MTNQAIERITLDAEGNAVCPNEGPHEPHSNAVWSDWQSAEVWECTGEES